jgi:hypothetical protein
VKAGVRKTVGVYERPQKSRITPRLAALAVVLAVAAAAGAAALFFF